MWGWGCHREPAGETELDGSSYIQDPVVLEVTYCLNVQGCMSKNTLPQPYFGRSQLAGFLLFVMERFNLTTKSETVLSFPYHKPAPLSTFPMAKSGTVDHLFPL